MIDFTSLLRTRADDGKSWSTRPPALSCLGARTAQGSPRAELGRGSDRGQETLELPIAVRLGEVVQDGAELDVKFFPGSKTDEPDEVLC